jgi:tetratricopeptide (TPR) repeat protein
LLVIMERWTLNVERNVMNPFRQPEEGRMLQSFDPIDSGQMVPGSGISVAWAGEGIARAYAGDLPSALRCLQRALAIDDDCYEGWLGLTKVFKAMQENDRAARCLSIARRIRSRLGHEDPGSASA